MSEAPLLLLPSRELCEAIQDMAREHREAGQERCAAAEEDFSAWPAR